MRYTLILTLFLCAQLGLNGQSAQKYTTLNEAMKASEKVEWLDLICEDVPKIANRFGELPKLESLYLRGCKLSELPEGMEEASNLGLLNVQDNDLKTLPTELSELKELSVINLRNNAFRKVPKALLSLPKLREVDLTGNKELKLKRALDQYPGECV